jgi:hypothetical protein
VLAANARPRPSTRCMSAAPSSMEFMPPGVLPGADRSTALMLLGVGAAAGLALALMRLAGWLRQRQQHASKLAALKKLELLPEERGRALGGSPPISTVTFFTGDTAAASHHFAQVGTTQPPQTSTHSQLSHALALATTRMSPPSCLLSFGLALGV